MPPYIWMPPYVWMHPLCLDAPYVWMAPVCLNAPMFGQHPYVWMPPFMFGHPVCLDAPMCMDSPPVCLDVWTPPVCLDNVWIPPYIHNIKKACFVTLRECQYAPIHLNSPCIITYFILFVHGLLAVAIFQQRSSLALLLSVVLLGTCLVKPIVLDYFVTLTRNEKVLLLDFPMYLPNLHYIYSKLLFIYFFNI